MENIKNLISEHSQIWQEGIQGVREMILANLVMVSQIPAPSFSEEQRAAFIHDRFIESGISDPYIDDIGNVIGHIKGKSSNRKILLSAHMDTLFDGSTDHNVTIATDRATGTAIADNGMGVTTLLSLPDILSRLDLEFDADLYFIATAASKEKGDLAGMRHYMDRYHEEIDFNVNLEGISLGQVDHFALSRVRCDIECAMDTKEHSSWRSVEQNSAIMMLNDVMEKLFSIPIPRKPKTILNIGRIQGGNSYSRICENAKLSLEVRSEDDLITQRLIEDIKDNCRDISANYGLDINLNFFSRHHAAGIRYSHPMVKAISTILKELGIQLKVSPSNSEIAVPLKYGIPSVTLGITTGAEDRPDKTSYINLEPISKGILQILLLLDAIDKGHCDDEFK
jgi:tripeptide aminopeptidase